MRTEKCDFYLQLGDTEVCMRRCVNCTFARRIPKGFEVCKSCGGSGIFMAHSKSKETMMKCKPCNNSGMLSWTDIILR